MCIAKSNNAFAPAEFNFVGDTMVVRKVINRIRMD